MLKEYLLALIAQTKTSNMIDIQLCIYQKSSPFNNF
jgi:hypothetical protein